MDERDDAPPGASEDDTPGLGVDASDDEVPEPSEPA